MAVLAVLDKTTGIQGVSLSPPRGGLRRFGGLKNVGGLGGLSKTRVRLAALDDHFPRATTRTSPLRNASATTPVA